MNSKLIQKHLSGNCPVFFCYHGNWKSRCAMRFFSSGIQNLGHATQLGCNRWTCSCTKPMNMKFHTQRELRQKKTDGHAAAHTTGKIIVYRVPNSLLNVFFTGTPKPKTLPSAIQKHSAKGRNSGKSILCRMLPKIQLAKRGYSAKHVIRVPCFAAETLVQNGS